MSKASAWRPSCQRRRPRLRRPLRNNVVSPRSCADPQRRAERAIGGIESLEQRREVALAEVDLGQPGGTALSCEMRDQRVDDLLLARAQAERLAQPLLLEQQVRREIALFALGQPADPLERLIHRAQRVGELADRDRPLRGATAETDRRRPVFSVPEMMREPRRPSSMRFACVDASAWPIAPWSVFRWWPTRLS